MKNPNVYSDGSPKYLIAIWWVDASINVSEFTLKKAEEDDFEKYIFLTVGILVHENNERFILATDYLINSKGEYRSSMVIPKGWIIKAIKTEISDSED